MGLTENQRRAIAELEAWGDQVLVALESGRAGPPVGGLAARMQDMCLEEVPMCSALGVQSTVRELHAAVGTAATVRVLLGICKVTVKDQTGWPIEGVNVEIWSQALGKTNKNGQWVSPNFQPGTYDLKLFSPFTGPPSGGPDAPVVVSTVMSSTVFGEQPRIITRTLGLAAGRLSVADRIQRILERAVASAPSEIGNQLKQLISAESIALFATLAALWVAGHVVAVGWIADGVAIVAIAIKLGLTAAMAASLAHDLATFLSGIALGKNEFDLQQAGEALSRAVVTVGMTVLMAICVTAVKKAVPPRGKFRPEGAPEEPAIPSDKPQPAKPGEVPPTGVSPLAQRLSTIMGDATYNDRIAAAEAAAERDPTLASVPRDDLASLRGYTEGGDKDPPSQAALDYRATHPDYKAKKPKAPDVKHDYQVINTTLRDADTKGYGAIWEYVESLLRGLERMPSRRAKCFRVITRGTDSVDESKLKPGHVFMDKALLSTSKDPAVARDFGENQPSILFIIQGYSGRSVSSISRFPREAELLFRPGTRFFVTSRKVIGENRAHLKVTMFEIRPDLSVFASLWGTQNVFIGYLKSLRGDEGQKNGGQP